MGLIFIVVGIFGIFMIMSFNASVPDWARSQFESFDILSAFLPIAIGGILLIYGLLPGKDAEFTGLRPPQPSAAPEVIQKEVIVKIRCSYCGSLYEETLNKCPNCGGRK
jgi:hypothetical protein